MIISKTYRLARPAADAGGEEMSEPQCPICGSLSDSERHNQLKKEYGELKVKEFKILLENAALQKRIAELEAAHIQTDVVLQRYIAKFGECGELHDLPPVPEVEA